MHVSLFSQSGSEIKALADKGFKPDVILTNNMSPSSWTDGISGVAPVFKVGSHKALMERLRALPKGTLVTLHGYLRIIPDDLCEHLNIINGHPGLITMYPQLKGKDPQDRITDDMEWIGSVVHRVTPEVDGGAILSSAKTKNIESLKYNLLKTTSIEAWELYFERNHTESL